MKEKKRNGKSKTNLMKKKNKVIRNKKNMNMRERAENLTKKKREENVVLFVRAGVPFVFFILCGENTLINNLVIMGSEKAKDKQNKNILHIRKKKKY